MSNKLENIGIIGAGAWGTALACNLSKKKIILWAYEKKVVSEINKCYQYISSDTTKCRTSPCT